MGKLFTRSTIAGLALATMMPMTSAFADADIQRRGVRIGSDGGDRQDRYGQYHYGDRYDRYGNWRNRNRGGIRIGIGFGYGYRDRDYGYRNSAWTCSYNGHNYRGRHIRVMSGAYWNRYTAQNRGLRRCMNSGLSRCYLVGCYRH